jgi:hypothetical protein
MGNEGVMEVSIHRAEGYWTVHDGVQFAVPKIHRMVADTESLLVLIDSIHAVYPDCRIKLDPSVSKNPYTGIWRHRLDYDIKRIQKILDHPEIRECGLCGREAWYYIDWPRSGFEGWKCCITKCSALQYGNDNYWYRLSKHARR